jgi:hypothetical protein
MRRPDGARSSCARRSKRASVIENRSRSLRRTARSISVVQVMSRSHSRSASWCAPVTRVS